MCICYSMCPPRAQYLAWETLGLSLSLHTLNQSIRLACKLIPGAAKLVSTILLAESEGLGMESWSASLPSSVHPLITPLRLLPSPNLGEPQLRSYMKPERPPNVADCLKSQGELLPNPSCTARGTAQRVYTVPPIATCT